jgi:hypothetical protein
MSSRNMRLLPWAALHSDSEHYIYIILYFLFLEISYPNFTLLSKSEIYNSTNALASPCCQIINIKFPKWNDKILP